jgi:hypothetical protein
MDNIISMHLYYESGAQQQLIDQLQAVVVWTEREEATDDDDDDEWRANFLSQAWTSSGS